jgi:hypothetical protein
MGSGVMFSGALGVMQGRPRTGALAMQPVDGHIRQVQTDQPAARSAGTAWRSAMNPPAVIHSERRRRSVVDEQAASVGRSYPRPNTGPATSRSNTTRTSIRQG